MGGKRVLIAGESWVMHTIHQKGFDHFTTTAYGEGHQWLSAALTGGGFAVEHLPNHLANERFPQTVDELRAYDAVLLLAYGLQVSNGQRGLALAHAMQQVAKGKGTPARWDAAGVAAALAALRVGAHPDVTGASGPMA